MTDNSTNANASATSPVRCRWDLSIDDCEDTKFFMITLALSMALFTILFIGAIGHFIWRRRRGNVLWIETCFTPLDGLLFWVIVWAMLRIIASVVMALDLWPRSVGRYALFDVSWWTANVAVATYTSGLFHAIPKMQLHQRSGRAYATWLPRRYYVPWFYWGYVLTTAATFETLAILAAVREGAHRYDEAKKLWRAHWVIYAIAQVLLTVVLLYYGQILVTLARESCKLATHVEEQRRYKKFANKMRLLNLGCAMAFVWYIVGLFSFAFMAEEIYEKANANKSYAILSELWSPAFGIAVLVGMMYSEHTSKIPGGCEELSSMWSVSQCSSAEEKNGSP